MAEKVKASPSLMASRLAVFGVFFSAGVMTASWFSEIPRVAEALQISEGDIGLAIMLSSAGVILGVTLTSGLIARFSSRNVSIAAGLLMAVVLSLLGLMQNFWALAATLFFFGMFTSMMDIGMNAQAAEVERLRQRSIMSSFHAGWSSGYFAGSLIASATIALGMSIFQHMLLISIVFALILLLMLRFLLPIEGEENPENTAAFQFPPRAVWGLGAIAFASALAEGSVGDWSGLYLKDTVGVSEALSTWGLSALAMSMTIFRFLGDRLTEQFGAERMVRGGGALSASGILLVLLFPILPVALLGFALVGTGLAVSIPLAFSAAGKMEGLPSGRGIAGVATLGYSAFLIGPAFIGLLAEVTSLRFAFVVILLLAASLIFTGRALRGK